MSSFCKLEKDEKTYKILKLYYDDYKNNQIVGNEDNRIQCEEMEIHNRRQGKDDTFNWIVDNAKKYRKYLNTIKHLCSIFYCSNVELNWENFCDYVDMHNKCEEIILNKIFLDL